MSDLAVAPAVEPTPTTSSDPWTHVVPTRVVARIGDFALDVVAAAAIVTFGLLLKYIGLLIGEGVPIINKSTLDAIGDFLIPIGAIIGAVLFHFYNHVWLVSERGASLVKGYLGLDIRADGEHPSVGSALIRELVTLVLTPIVGFVSALLNRDRHALADMIAGTAVRSRDASEPPGVLRDARVFRVVGQIVAVVAVAGIGWWLLNNLRTNLDETGIATNFDFLDGPTNFRIPFDEGFDDRSPVRSMIWVGVRNTIISAIVGIAIAMVLGTLIGIARLSTNWLVAKLSALYVEIFRNIPPLVIILFFGAAIFTNGPFPLFNPRNPPWAYTVPGSEDNILILSNTVWGIPSFRADGNTGIFWLLVLLGLAAAVVTWMWRTALNVNTGKPHRRVLWSVGVFLLIAVIAFFLTGGPYAMSWPAVSESGRRIEGGFVMNFGWIAVTLALGLYTASHIAEIIRGSILAVPKGQSEASNALALSGFQRYRFVILPQAARIAIPPVINQWLNLTKNTSLGIAVAYAEITALTKTSIGNGRPAVPSLVILISIYLFFSISISIALNFINKRAQLVGR